jgi:hypothetical protein
MNTSISLDPALAVGTSGSAVGHYTGSIVEFSRNLQLLQDAPACRVRESSINLVELNHVLVG